MKIPKIHVSFLRTLFVLVMGAQIGASTARAQVAAPLFAPSSADSTVAMEVTITCPTSGAEIRYTLNGEEPTIYDPVVTNGGTITISRHSVLKARAWSGATAGPVTSEDYRITGAISCGYQHGLALSVAGRIWSWGEQAGGRLGNGLTAGAEVVTPARVQLGAGYFDTGSLIAAGYDHSLVIDQDGNLWSFGENGDGQLGNNSTTDSGSPVRVLKSTTAGDYLGSSIGTDAGQSWSLALLSSGTPVTWGIQSSGRLANGANSSSTRNYAGSVLRGDDPGFPALTGIRQIAAGHGHGLAREPNASEQSGGTGRVWVWGSNTSGQLGLGSTTHGVRAVPMLLNSTTELTDALDVSGGGAHTAVLRWKEGDSDLAGTVWCCGNQSNGRLGNGSTSSADIKYPVRVIKVDSNPLTGVRQVSAGPTHTLAVDADGHVWSWGNNQYGQLGDGTTSHSGHAKQVKDAAGTGVLQDIVMVSAGGESTNGRSMALAEDGTIWVWGRNDEGRLGNGGTAGVVSLPVAHAQNHVTEGEPSLTLDYDVTDSIDEGEVAIDATPSHSGPDGFDEIDRVDIFLNGQLVETLYPENCHCVVEGLTAGSYQIYGIVHDYNGVTAQSASSNFIILVPEEDADEDGLPNGVEVPGSDPFDPDSDLDGMADGWEAYYGFPVMDGQLSNLEDTGASDDYDGDGKDNLEEYLAGLVPVGDYEQPYQNTTPDRLTWFGKAGIVYGVEVATSQPYDEWSWQDTGFRMLGENQEIELQQSTEFPWLAYEGLYYRIVSTPVAASGDWDGDGISNGLELTVGGVDPVVPEEIGLVVDGVLVPNGGSVTIPLQFGYGETEVEIPIRLPSALAGLGEWEESFDNGDLWWPLAVNNGTIPVGNEGTLLVRFRIGGEIIWQGTLHFDLLWPSSQKEALTRFTLSNSSASPHATIMGPAGIPQLSGGGCAGNLQLKKSAVTGSYFLEVAVDIDPNSAFDPTDYGYRVFSSFDPPVEFEGMVDPTASPSDASPFPTVRTGPEIIPFPVVSGTFPESGRATIQIIPYLHGDGDYTVQIVSAQTGEPYAEGSASGSSSCGSCTTCIASPTLNLGGLGDPLQVPLGSSAGTDPAEAWPPDTDASDPGQEPAGPDDLQNPPPKYDGCTTGGELGVKILGLDNPNVTVIGNPGRAGLSVNAARGAYQIEIDPLSGMISEIRGERQLLITPLIGSSDPDAFKVTGYTIPDNSASEYMSMTVEKVTEAGLPVLKVTETLETASGTSTRVNRYRKETAGATVSAVLELNDGAREIRREITPGSHSEVWTERRKILERPTLGGNRVLVSDEELKFRRLTTGVTRLVSKVVDPDYKALRTDYFYYEGYEDSGGSLGPSSIGAGMLEREVGHAGEVREFEYSEGNRLMSSSYAGQPGGRVEKTTASSSPLAVAADVMGEAGSSAGSGNKNFIARTVTSDSGSGSSTTEVKGEQWGGAAVITGDGAGVAIRQYKPRTDSTAPGRLERELEPGGRLTTWDYTVEDDVEICLEESGEPNSAGTAVAKGERTVTTTTSCKRLLSEEVFGFNNELEKSDPVFLSGRYIDPADYDPIGRPLKIYYESPTSDDFETFTYNCCGLGTHVGRRGEISVYQYDDLKRVAIKTVKGSAAGPEVSYATLRDGLAVTLAREGVVVSGTTRNLTGELVSALTADENGDGNPEATTWQHTYSSAGTWVSETGPDGATSLRQSHPDGRVRAVWGSAVADRAYTYERGYHLSPYVEVVTEYLVAGNYPVPLQGEKEWVKTAYDGEGRKVAQWHSLSGNAKALWVYDPVTGLLESATDADGVVTSYTYHADGSLWQTIRQISNSRVLVSSREYGYVDDTVLGGGSRFEESYLQTVVGQVSGLSPVFTTWARGDGYASRSLSASSGAQQAFASFPNTTDRATGEWTSTIIAADLTRIRSDYENGLLVQRSYLDATEAVVSWTGYAYDSLGRLLATEDSRTGVTTHDSNDDDVPEVTPSGNVLYSRDPGGRVTTFAYDSLGRRVETTLPNSSVQHTTYDGMGNVIAEWGSQTYPQRYGYDGQGRRVSLDTWRNDPPAGDPAAATGHDRTQWLYDDAGRLEAKRDALGRGADYGYSAAGRLEFRQWARTLPGSSTRVTTSYEYDGGLLEQVNYNDPITPDVVFTHDGYGRVKTVTQAGNTWSYDYDPDQWFLEREHLSYDFDANGTPDVKRIVQHQSDSIGRTTGRSIGADTNNSPASLEILDDIASYYYDAAGRIDRVSASLSLPGPSGADFTYQYEPDSASLVKYITSSYGVTWNVWEAERDIFLRRESRTHSYVPLAFQYYSRDHLGRISFRVELYNEVLDEENPSYSPRDYEYNLRGELVSESYVATAYPPGNHPHDRGYDYDGLGNRLATSSGNSEVSEASLADKGTYLDAPDGEPGANPLNQYGQIKLPGGIPVAVDHDHDGNMETGPLPAAPDESSLLKWDAENRLIECQVGTSGPLVQFSYDPFGRRIRKTVVGGASEIYLYDGWNLAVRYSSSGTALTSYLWGLDSSGTLQGAGGVGGLLSIREKAGNGSVKAGKNICPLYDANQNITHLVDPSSGVVKVASYAYDGFGNFVGYENSDTDGSGYAYEQPFGFSTKFRDFETGLYYYGYRYYEPVAGRWPSRDPLGENWDTGEFNLFVMVRNNPMSYIDILGRELSIAPSKPFPKDRDLKPEDFKNPEWDAAVERIAKCCPEIKKILQALKDSPNKHRINFSDLGEKGMSHVRLDNSEDGGNGVGTGSEADINSRPRVDLPRDGSITCDATIMHELSHMLDADRGRTKKGKGSGGVNKDEEDASRLQNHYTRQHNAATGGNEPERTTYGGDPIDSPSGPPNPIPGEPGSKQKKGGKP